MAIINGTGSPEVLNGTSGSDTINAGGGNDLINGGAGVDILNGEGGDDIFEVGMSQPVIVGGLNVGFDYYNGGSGYDTIWIIGAAGYEWTALEIGGMDSIEAIRNVGGDAQGIILFSGTLDFSGLQELSGITQIGGSSGADHFTGSNFYDPIYGLDGNDVLDGRGGDDLIVGGAGNDTLIGGEGSDTFVVDRNGGLDSYHGGTAAGVADTDVDIIQIIDQSGLTGDINVNIQAMSDIEVIWNTSSSDAYLNFSSSIDLTGIQLIDITGVRGGSGNDTIVGTLSDDSSLGGARGISIEGMGGNDDLYGSIGDDQIDGGTGTDRILAGAGDDIISGGAGMDQFWIGSNDGIDIITDFTHGEDLFVAYGVNNITISAYDDGSGILQALIGFDDTLVLALGVDPFSLNSGDFGFA